MLGHFAIHSTFAYYSPMAGERASTTRQREAGKICWECRTPIDYDPTHPHGERLCQRCTQARESKKRIYMSFARKQGWYCEFVEDGVETPLPRKFTFATEDKVRELVRRCGGLSDLASKQALEYGISSGRGGVYLNPTQEQYNLLKRSMP